MATMPTTPTYSNKASIYLAPIITLGVIALTLVVARIHTRVKRTGKLHLDDWLIVAATLISTAGVVVAIVATAYGWGKPKAYFEPHQLQVTIRLMFVLQTLWVLSLCLVRLSVACSLLRFGDDKKWRRPLYLIMALQVLMSTSHLVIQFAQCRPISANWSTVPGAVCWKLGPILVNAWVSAGLYIVFDLVLSLMPIRLILSLQRKPLEKILICILMSLGLFATAIACVKLSTFPSFGQGDIMQGSILPSLWAKAEEQAGIIASSVPCLKGPIEILLVRSGILSEHQWNTPNSIGNFSIPTVKNDDMKSSREASTGRSNVRSDRAPNSLRKVDSMASLEMQHKHTWQAV